MSNAPPFRQFNHILTLMPHYPPPTAGEVGHGGTYLVHYECALTGIGVVAISYYKREGDDNYN